MDSAFNLSSEEAFYPLFSSAKVTELLTFHVLVLARGEAGAGADSGAGGSLNSKYTGKGGRR